MMNKNYVPYYIAGTLATFTLLASGVFAAAPYIGFLAPVTALSVGLPFIIGCVVFSVVTIVLSYKAISKNKTISEKDAQLANQAKEIEGKDKTVSEKETQLAEKDAEVQAQKQTISEKDAQLASQAKEIEGKDKIISEKEATVQAQKQTISEKDAQLSEKEKEIEELKRGNAFVPQAKDIKEVFTSVAEAYNSGRILDIVKRRCSDVANDLKNIVGSAKNACGTSVEYVKGKCNNAGNKLKNVYDTMPSTESVKGALGNIGNDMKSVYNTSVECTKGALNNVGSGLKNTCDTSIESAKGTISSVGNKLKNFYDTSVEYTKGALNSVGSSGSSLYSRFHGTKVSSKEKFESRVVQRKQEEVKARTELKASGSLPDVIELQYKISSPEEQFKREDGSKPSMQEITRLDYLDLVVPSSEQKQRANSLGYLNIDNVPKQHDHLSIDAAKSYLMSLSKEETKANGYLNQAMSTANWLASQAIKAMPYLAASYLPYVFYNYATTPVSASFDDVNVTQSFVANSGIISPIL